MITRSGFLIKTSGLNFYYGKHAVLHDINLEINQGQIAGLLGPNGSGKSTLLKVISGIMHDYTGSVQIGGEDVRTIPRRKLAKTLAMVPQESVFGFPFSVLQVVLMGRHPHLVGLAFESSTDITIAREALARCGASELANRSIQELSSGERQRVIFARALAQQPNILLLDEPASFLDIRYQVELYEIVRELAQNKKCTVITVLHELNLAAEYCDQVYLLKNGYIQSGGTTTEILNYSNLTRTFNTDVYVDTNSLTGNPLVIPLSKKAVDLYKKRCIKDT